MATAKAWHLTPSQFWALPSWERAYILEFEQETAKMQQFDREEAERKSKVRQMVERVKQKLGSRR